MTKIINHEETMKEYYRNNYNNLIKRVEGQLQIESEKGNYKTNIENYVYEIIYGEFTKRGFHLYDKNFISWEKPTTYSIEQGNAMYYRNIAERYNECVLKEINKRIKNIITNDCGTLIDLEDLKISDTVSRELARAGYYYNDLTKTFCAIF